VIPTEPIGSIPRPRELVEGTQAAAAGELAPDELESMYAQAVRETIAELEATGSPVITDGEQRKPSFATYAIEASLRGPYRPDRPHRRDAGAGP
jgi:5-methyltetrahydropteroyltriglutamate--homocysteine methyltransferase